MSEEYNEDNRIVVFKNDKKDNTKAPDWSGRLVITKELAKEVLNNHEGEVRVALWKTTPKSGGQFFLSGQISEPYVPQQEEEDPFDDDDDF